MSEHFAKRINGVWYDTKDAELIAETRRMCGPDAIHERLYRRFDGKYFVHGLGGSCQGGVVSDSTEEDIRALTEEEVWRWGFL